MSTGTPLSHAAGFIANQTPRIVTSRFGVLFSQIAPGAVSNCIETRCISVRLAREAILRSA